MYGSIKIDKVDLRIFLFLIPFFQPWWLTRIGILDNVYDLFKLLICFLVLTRILQNKVKISLFSKIYVAYRVFICGVSLWGDAFDFGYLLESFQFIGLIILLENLIKLYGKRVLKIICIIFSIILFINLITYTPSGIIFEPNGFYLLGIHTRIAELAIPTIALALFYNKSSNKGKLILLTVLISALSFFILEWVATALTCTVFFFGMFFLGKLIHKKFKNVYCLILIITVIACSLGVVFFNIQELFAGLIEKYLNKSATLTGRTDLWNIAINIVKEKWICGYGFKNQGDFVSMYDFTTTSHNQWLQTMFYGGAIGSILYYSIPILAIKNCISEIKYNDKVYILLIGLATIIIMCTTEIAMDNIYYLTFIICMYNCKEFYSDVKSK